MKIKFAKKLFLYETNTNNEEIIITPSGFIHSQINGPMEIERYNPFEDKIEKGIGYERISKYYKLSLKYPWILKTTLKQTVI